MTRILITGAGGFIGSRLVAYFQNIGGYDVYAMMRTLPPCSAPAQAAHTIAVDLADYMAVEGHLRHIHPDIVIHTAGLTPHRGGTIADTDYHAQNTDHAENILECLREMRRRGHDSYRPALIFASSVSVYGRPQSPDGIVREGDPLHPQHAYARSKADFEAILQAQTDIPHAILRYGNIPGRDGFIRFVTDHHRADFYGAEPFIRDYIHPDDLCSLHDCAAKHLISGGHSVISNAGSGVGLSFAAIVDEIERQTEISVTRQTYPIRENDIPCVICDIQTAKDVLHWSPSRTTATDIVSYALHAHIRSPQTPD